MGHINIDHYNKLAEKFSSNKQEFAKKANMIHNDLYLYDNVIYKNNKTLISITCKIHGDFLQRPDNHLNLKHGCPKCKAIKNGKRLLSNTEEFIEKANKIHNNKYDYSESIYNNIKSKLIITCPIHGKFEHQADLHLQGKEGCKKCMHTGTSDQEKELFDFVNNIIKSVSNSKKIIYPLELDIFIPSMNKAIEYNGTYWHYDRTNPRCKPKGYHSMKSKLCKEKGIKLLHIREDLWVNKKEKIKEVIIKFLK